MKMGKKMQSVAGSIILICILMLTGCSNKQTLDFKEITDIQFNGLNGKGTVSISENDKIYENNDFLEQLYPDNSSKKAKEKLTDLLNDVKYTFSKETELSNGDEITVKIEYDNDKIKKDELTVENKEFTVTVSGLAEGTQIDPFDGLQIIYSGLSGNGHAVFDSSNCNEFVQEYVTFGYTKENLSNGDTVTVSANYSAKIAEEQFIIIENETKEFTVSGLKEPVELDPFEKLSITYTGASPYIKAVADSTKCDSMVNQYIQFNIEDKYLRNGDTFTVSAVYNEYDAEENGFIVKKDTHTYTVENQPEYVTSLDGLDLKALQTELDDKLTSFTAANEGDYRFADVYMGYFQSIAEKKYRIAYLVSLKTSFEDKFDGYNYNYNRYIQIYEYIVNEANVGHKKVYIAVYVNNIQKNADGTISWDIELGSKSDENYDSIVNKFATSEKEFYNVSEIKVKEDKSAGN